jgi:hypothetical protein
MSGDRKRFLNRIYRKNLPIADTIKFGEGLLDSLYPGMTRDEISQLLYETWSRPYIFEDFTLFKEQPYKGRYVNVDENGFRISKHQGTWPPAKEKDFSIFVFGGSSAFGYGVSDSETVASFSQEGLSKAGLKRAPFVYNFGRGHYYSTQERILFEKLLAEGHVPDMAVFLDGLNEFFYYSDNGTALSSSFEKLLRGDLGELFLKELRKRYSVLRSLRNMRKRIKRLFTRSAGLQRRERGTPDPAGLMKVIERYMINKRMIEATGAAFNVQTVFVWQPIPGYEYDLSLHPFVKGGFGRHGYSREGYPLMKEYVESHDLGNNFLWCAGIGKEAKEPLYVDLTHYSPRMSALFAEIICGLLGQRNLLSGAGGR